MRRGIRKYTAFVPKTVRATTNLGKKVLRGATSVLNGAVRVARTSAKAVNRTTAKAIRSLTQRRSRKHMKKSRKHTKRS